jgi:ABC-type branched-subunit amino acid transport system substrate-binding protein
LFSLVRSPHRLRPALFALVATVALVFGASASVAKTTSSSAKVIKVALIDDLTGGFSAISGPQPSLAFIKDLNAHGGMNGYKVVTKIYDGQSSDAGTLQSARRAMQDHPNAILMGSWNAASANAFLSKTGVPVIGFGALGGYGGYNNVFSDIGEAGSHASDVWMRILALKGVKKVALLDTIYEGKFDALLQRLAPGTGLKVVYDNATLPYPVDSPTALSLAQAVKQSGADGVYAAAGGDLVQADLNQLGVKVSVLEVSAFGPAVIKQWGSKVNGMIFGSAFASAYVKNKAVSKYVALMSKYGYSSSTYNNPYAIEHYAATKMLFDAMKKVKAPYRASSIVASLNKLHRYTGGGLLPFVSFPEWHSISNDCAATATVVDGKWIADKNGTNPFVCSLTGSKGL